MELLLVPHSPLRLCYAPVAHLYFVEYLPTVVRKCVRLGQVKHLLANEIMDFETSIVGHDSIDFYLLLMTRVSDNMVYPF